MGSELIIDFKKKENFSKDGIEFKFTKDLLTIVFGKNKNTIRFTKDNVSYGKELIPIVDVRKYNSNKTISVDFDELKKLFETKLEIARKEQNFKNAVKAKVELLNLYVSGKLAEQNIEITRFELRNEFDICDYEFQFNYKDVDFIVLDFDELEIFCSYSKKCWKFSEFLSTVSPILKKRKDALELYEKLDLKVDDIIGVAEDCDEEDCDEEDCDFW